MRASIKCGVRRDVQELKVGEFVAIGNSLKEERLGSLELYIDREARPRYTFLSTRHSETMSSFSRALAWAVSTGGWLQRLELGFCLCHKDLQLLVHALCLSKTLKYLSFANSGLGDANLQLLVKGFRECAPLEVLSLKGCNLTDAIAPVLGSLLKANLSRRIQEDWQNSLRDYRQHLKGGPARYRLRALDLSWNNLTDVSMKVMCTIFQLGPSVEALDVRGNKLQLESHKLFQDVMNEWSILKYVDMTQSGGNSLLGVLDYGSCTREELFPFTEQTARQKAEWKNVSVRTLIKRKSQPKRAESVKTSMANSSAKRNARKSGSASTRSSLKSDTQLPSSNSTLPRTQASSIRSSVEDATARLEDSDCYDPWKDGTSTEGRTSSCNSRFKPTVHDDLDIRRSIVPRCGEFGGSAKKNVNKEWNGFLTDIGRALLQLNDRLDKLIGPSAPSSELRTKLLSKLKALD